MNDETRPADDPIGRLVRLVGPREGVPAEREQRVRTAVHAAWRGEVRRRSRRRMVWAIGSLAAAAALVLALGPGLRDRLTTRPAPLAETVATVETAAGVPGLTAGDGVSRDATLETGDGGSVALRLAGGAAVRLDARTRLALRSASALALESGALYVDSGGDGGALEIRTAFGVARDVGTRFEVRVGEASVRLRVREGEVVLEHGGTTHTADAGVELEAGAEGVTRRVTAPYGPHWDWVLSAAPPFELDGRTLAEILDWTARETGREVRPDPAVRTKLREVFVGSLASPRPDAVLDGVLATFGLRARADGGTLWVEPFTP